MQNFKLPLTGISRASSPYQSDGECAELVNFYPENGYLHPAAEERPVYPMPAGRTLIFVHRNQTFEHWLTYDGACLYFEAAESNGTVTTQNSLVLQMAGVTKVESVGNTLIVRSDTQKCYVLYKEGRYKRLGEQPDMPEASFWVSMYMDRESEEIAMTVPNGQFSPADCDRVTAQVMPVVAKEVEKFYGEGYFIHPVLLRYAFRLYDGEMIYQSQPFLLSASDTLRPVTVPRVDTQYLRKIRVRTRCANLSYSFTGLNSDWSDIVRSIDFFVSPPLYTLDTEGKISSASETELRLPGPTISQLRERTASTGNFFLVHSQLVPAGSSVTGTIDPKEKTLLNLASQEPLPDDYDSHCLIGGRQSLVYNARLHLADISKRLFRGFCPVQLQASAGTMKSVSVSVLIKTDAGDAEVVYSCDLGNGRCRGDLLPYFFYPDARAYRVFVTEATDNGIRKATFALKAHPRLNGAYYLTDNLLALAPGPASTHSHVHRPMNEVESFPNRMYVSETNNPFSFPLKQIYSISSGRILGMASATAALSQGQFGQFPLYVFTDDGVWALETAESGYRSQHPVTRDVCNNPTSILQLDNAVAFSTEKGLMLLAGAESSILSQALDNEVFDLRAQLPGIASFIDLPGQPSIGAAIDRMRFSDYLKRAQTGYDYAHNRLVISHPERGYFYQYSLAEGMWSKQLGRYDYLLNSYPELYASTGASIVRLSAPRRPEENPALVTAFFVTRPFQLLPDVLKRIGQLAIHSGAGRAVTLLYGSRDGRTWTLAAAADGFGGDAPRRTLRMHGSPYRFFIVAHRALMQPAEPMGHLEVTAEPVYSNRLR